MTAELGTLVQIELPDYLEGHEIALKDADLGVEIALVVVVHHGHRVFEGDDVGIGFIDDDAADGFIDGRLAQAGDGDGHEDSRGDSEYHPLALDKNAHVFAQGRFLRRHCVIKRGNRS